MNFLNKLFGNLNLDVNNLVDNLTTTTEEKKELKIKFEALFLEQQSWLASCKHQTFDISFFSSINSIANFY